MNLSADRETRTAVLDLTHTYRYSLLRVFDDGPTCNSIMLNPSTADAAKDDPTIRRCVRFARDFGCGRLRVTNLFALRATDPLDLRRAADPVGPGNDAWIARIAKESSLVVCAWGVHGDFLGRAELVKLRLRNAGVELTALGFTVAGRPKHPLYLPASARPVPFA